MPDSSSAITLFKAYRFLTASDEHRQCRLQPTCSRFLVSAAHQHGWKGWLWGMARLQMEHSDQNGFLTARLGTDHFWIYDDPLEQWQP